jgi:hypothetical protein
MVMAHTQKRRNAGRHFTADVKRRARLKLQIFRGNCKTATRLRGLARMKFLAGVPLQQLLAKSGIVGLTRPERENRWEFRKLAPPQIRQPDDRGNDVLVHGILAHGVSLIIALQLNHRAEACRPLEAGLRGSPLRGGLESDRPLSALSFSQAAFSRSAMLFPPLLPRALARRQNPWRPHRPRRQWSALGGQCIRSRRFVDQTAPWIVARGLRGRPSGFAKQRGRDQEKRQNWRAHEKPPGAVADPNLILTYRTAPR